MADCLWRRSGRREEVRDPGYESRCVGLSAVMLLCSIAFDRLYPVVLTSHAAGAMLTAVLSWSVRDTLARRLLARRWPNGEEGSLLVDDRGLYAASIGLAALMLFPKLPGISLADAGGLRPGRL